MKFDNMKSIDGVSNDCIPIGTIKIPVCGFFAFCVNFFAYAEKKVVLDNTYIKK